MIEYVETKTILSTVAKEKTKYWFGYDYNLNIYRGCHHGCIYCDSRSDVYGVDNFDKVKPKRNAIEILEKELKSKRKKGVIGIGAMSDPYNKLEEELQLTRQTLELVNKYGFGIILATKSDLVLRDIDILKKIAEHSPVLIKITITCADDRFSKLIEPNVCPSSKRFEAIQKLNEAGIKAGILLMPVLPFITDTIENITNIMNKANNAQACFVYPGMGVSQRTGQREYYLKKLYEISPRLKEEHERRYGNKYSCPARNAQELTKLVHQLGKKYKIKTKMPEIIEMYKKGTRSEQISLF